MHCPLDFSSLEERIKARAREKLEAEVRKSFRDFVNCWCMCLGDADIAQLYAMRDRIIRERTPYMESRALADAAQTLMAGAAIRDATEKMVDNA